MHIGKGRGYVPQVYSRAEWSPPHIVIAVFQLPPSPMLHTFSIPLASVLWHSCLSWHSSRDREAAIWQQAKKKKVELTRHCSDYNCLKVAMSWKSGCGLASEPISRELRTEPSAGTTRSGRTASKADHLILGRSSSAPVTQDILATLFWWVGIVTQWNSLDATAVLNQHSLSISEKSPCHACQRLLQVTLVIWEEIFWVSVEWRSNTCI